MTGMFISTVQTAAGEEYLTHLSFLINTRALVTLFALIRSDQGADK